MQIVEAKWPATLRKANTCEDWMHLVDFPPFVQETFDFRIAFLRMIYFLERGLRQKENICFQILSTESRPLYRNELKRLSPLILYHFSHNDIYSP